MGRGEQKCSFKSEHLQTFLWEVAASHQGAECVVDLIRCCSRTEPFRSGMTQKGAYTKCLFMYLWRSVLVIRNKSINQICIWKICIWSPGAVWQLPTAPQKGIYLFLLKTAWFPFAMRRLFSVFLSCHLNIVVLNSTKWSLCYQIITSCLSPYPFP